ncbi:MAG TPA: transketolase [Dehalococcoidia bacterium]|jgi:transketolase|nr:transketolase [Dehalococcoidia bacterium]
MVLTQTSQYLIRDGLIKLLEIKDADIRLMTLRQARDAVDKGVHIGGAFSAVIPLVALFYGGMARFDITNPTRRGQDMFVLSKGHAVASMASIYADLGYFDRSVLQNSRSEESILNGHPGPILPGVHISTGPLGQGLGVAQGFALVGKMSPKFDVFCLTGDGELQEGIIWEAVMFSAYKKLDNLCVLVDKNSGQLDDTKQLVHPLPELDKRFACFGWRVFNVDATQYGPVLAALEEFKYSPREGKPTVIICRTRKGFGGASDFMVKHKVVMPDAVAEQEMALQERKRAARVAEFLDFFAGLGDAEDGGMVRERLLRAAKEMNLDIVLKEGKASEVKPLAVSVKTKRAPSRNKKVEYDAGELPKLEKGKEYACSGVVTQAMKVFARDPKVVSIDADLASSSGLEAGVAYVDMTRALNVGVAEPNMMAIAEGFAAMGFNAWCSTFGPFFDWRVLRRIAIGYEERLQAMAMKDGWLSEGHGLDITFLSTVPNFEQNTNGATHMSNDDVLILGGIAHLKVIDISCPNQLIAAMRWVMEGNRGLVYMRMERGAMPVIYDADLQFEYGKGYFLKESSADKAVIISSGRGVHEALAAAKELESSGIAVAVVDMPSIDEKLLLELYNSGKLLVIAEQNNGYIWSEFQKILFKANGSIDATKLVPINTLDSERRPQFIHSATYQQLLRRFGLSPAQLAETVRQKLAKG